MVCETVKQGANCLFMKKAGCSFNGGRCHPVVETCQGCDKIEDYPSGGYCKSFADPASKWSNGKCNFATHVKRENGLSKNKLNPLKASKRRLSA